ncbi:MAG: alcohol dehydrogenase catalytic domain-containing protein [Sphingomonadales bacterium]
MRAAVFEGAGKPLAIKDVPMPEPGPGELLIKVERCGVCGSDLHMTDSASCFNPPSGAIIGHEFCGEIVQLGAGTEKAWKEGQRIAALPYLGCGQCVFCLAGEPTRCATVRAKPSGDSSGGFAEYSVVGARESVLLPDHLSWDHGAFVEPIAVGVHAIAGADFKPGARILVVGAGPVGLAVAACAQAAGADTVCVTARSDRRGDLARTMGATEFLISDDKLADNFAKVAGGPPDVVFECVGMPGMMALCSDIAAPRSQVIMLGACMQEERFQPIVATMKELTFRFVVCYSKRDFEVATTMIANGRIDPLPMLSDTVDFNAFPDAFEALRQPHDQCKILLTPSKL